MKILRCTLVSLGVSSALGIQARIQAQLPPTALPVQDLSRPASGFAIAPGGPGGVLTVNQNPGSSRGVVSWTSFDIGRDATVRFEMSSPSGVVVNRVTGATLSDLQGRLTSTVPGGGAGGTVLLLNPNGVLVGPNAQINVGSFVASSLPMSTSDDEFLGGGSTVIFGSSATSPTGVIQSDGTIVASGGSISLIGARVVNRGSLTALNGGVGMAAAAQVELTELGRPGFETARVLADLPGTSEAPLVDHSAAGVITAVRTELDAAGGNVFALAINTKGLIRARTGDEIASLFRAKASNLHSPRNAGSTRIDSNIERVNSQGLPSTDGIVNAEIDGRIVEIAGTWDLGAQGKATVHAWETITQTSPVSVTGASMFSSGVPGDLQGGIQLEHQENDFTGTIGAFGGFVAIRDKNEMAVGDIGSMGSLDLIAGGAITQAEGSRVAVRAGTQLMAKSDTGLFDISLAPLQKGAFGGNDFGGAVTATGSGLTLEDAFGLVLGDVDLVGGLTLVAGGTVAQVRGSKLMVGGETEVTAIGNGQAWDIHLAALNDFKGAVNARGRVVELQDLDALSLGDIDAQGDINVWSGGMVNLEGRLSSQGNLNVIAGAAIHQLETSSVAVKERTRLEAMTNGEEQDIEFPGHNDFGGPVEVKGRLAVLHDDFGLRLGLVNAKGDVRLSAGREITIEDSFSAQGGLTAVAGGDILQTEGTRVAVKGVSELIAAADGQRYEVRLDNLNDFGGQVHARGQSVALQDEFDLKLGNVDALGDITVKAGRQIEIQGDVSTQGNLSAIAGGEIAQTEGTRVAVRGRTDLIALANGQRHDVRLANLNDFGEAVHVIGQEVTLGDEFGIRLADLSAQEDVTVRAGRGIVIDGELSSQGNLVLSAGGSIEQGDSSRIAVKGDTQLTAISDGQRYDITLPRMNDFGGHVRAEGLALFVQDEFDIKLSSVDATGNVTAWAGRQIHFDGDLSSQGDFQLRAGGPITQAPGTRVAVKGTIDLVARAGGQRYDVLLNNGDGSGLNPLGANDFGGPISVTGNNVGLRDEFGLQIGSVDALGDVDVKAGGNITISGIVSSQGDLTLESKGAIAQLDGSQVAVRERTTLRAANSAGEPSAIDLYSPINDFGDAVNVVVAGRIRLRDAFDLVLGETEGEGVELWAGGGISQKGPIRASIYSARADRGTVIFLNPLNKVSNGFQLVDQIQGGARPFSASGVSVWLGPERNWFVLGDGTTTYDPYAFVRYLIGYELPEAVLAKGLGEVTETVNQENLEKDRVWRDGENVRSLDGDVERSFSVLNPSKAN